MSAVAKLSIEDRVLKLRRGDVLRHKDQGTLVYLLRTPTPGRIWPLRVRTLGEGGKERKLYDHNLLDWRIADTDESALGFTQGPPRSGLNVATIAYYSWSQMVFARHRGLGSIHLLHESSTDLSNPWVMAGDLRLDPYQMAFFVHEKSGLPLIEHALGVRALPANPVGVLLKNLGTGAYAIYAGLASADHPGAVRIQLVAGEQVQLTNDLLDWQVVGPKRLLTLASVVEAEQHPSLRARASNVYWSARAFGYSPLSVAPGALGLGFGIASGMEVSMAIGAVSMLGLGPLWRWGGMTAATRSTSKDSAQHQLDAFIEPAQQEPKSPDQTHQQVGIDLPQPSADLLSQLYRDGEHLLAHSALLSELEIVEVNGLVQEHLPTALQLYQQSVLHLDESDRSTALAHLEGQLALIGARLSQLRQSMAARVLTEQDKHSRFLDAKLRKSDLD